jgi:hypothetical protein
MADAGSRVNPFRPTIEGSINAPNGVVPSAAPPKLAGGLDEPNAKTTADALIRYIESPDARHKRLFNRLPDVGGASLWQGIRTNVFKGREGGVPALPAALLRGLELPDPKSIPTQGTVLRGLRARIGAARRGLKPVVRLSPGLGGLDAAQSVRAVPDAPGGAREIIHDLRPKSIHGTFIGHRTAPVSVVDALASKRATMMLPPPPPEQTSTDSLASTTSPPNLAQSKPVPTEPIALVANLASEGGEPSPTMPWGLIAVAAVAFLVLSKS